MFAERRPGDYPGSLASTCKTCSKIMRPPSRTGYVASGEHGPVQRILDFLFGYDYFLAHRSADGSRYALALYSALSDSRRGLNCFLDIKHYPAGSHLPLLQTRALSKTTRLVVIVTAGAHAAGAANLWAEVREFREKHPNGKIIPVGSRVTLSADHFPDSQLLPLLPAFPNDLCVLEDEDHLRNGQLSKWIPEKLLNDFSEERSSVKRQRWIRRVAVILLILLLTSIGSTVSALRQLREAKRQRAFAQKSEASAQTLIKDMIFDLPVKLRAVGRQDLLNDVAQSAYQHFLIFPPSNKVLDQHQYAALLGNIGEISISAGRSVEARAMLNKKLGILDALLKGDPASAYLQREVAITLLTLGDVIPAGSSAERLRITERAVELLVSSTRAESTSVLWQRDLSSAYTRVASLYRAMGEPVKAEEAITKSIRLLEQLISHAPKDNELLHDLAIIYGVFAALHADDATTKTSREAYEKSIKLLEEIVSNEPNQFQWRRELSISYGEFEVFLLSRCQDRAGAISFGKRMVEQHEALVKHDPSNLEIQRELAVSYTKLARSLIESDRAIEAGPLYDKAITIREGLVKKDSNNTKWKGDLAREHRDLALFFQHSDVKRALSSITESVAMREALAEEDPDDLTAQIELVNSLALQSSLMLASENKVEALKTAKRAEAILSAFPPQAISVLRVSLAHAYNQVGDVFRSASDFASAVGVNDKAIDLLTQGVNNYSTEDAPPILLALYANRSVLSLELGDVPGALEAARLSLVLARKQVAERTDKISSYRNFSIAADRYCYVLWKKQSFNETAAIREEQLNIAEKSGLLAGEVAGCYQMVSWTSLLSRNFSRALSAAQRAKEIDPSNVDCDRSIAHALLFLGRYKEALVIYKAFVGRRSGESRSCWEDLIREQFDFFRELGFEESGMNNVEREFRNMESGKG